MSISDLEWARGNVDAFLRALERGQNVPDRDIGLLLRNLSRAFAGSPVSEKLEKLAQELAKSRP